MISDRISYDISKTMLVMQQEYEPRSSNSVRVCSKLLLYSNSNISSRVLLVRGCIQSTITLLQLKQRRTTTATTKRKMKNHHHCHRHLQHNFTPIEIDTTLYLYHHHHRHCGNIINNNTDIKKRRL